MCGMISADRLKVFCGMGISRFKRGEGKTSSPGGFLKAVNKSRATSNGQDIII
jgi:hypothetical protein